MQTGSISDGVVFHKKQRRQTDMNEDISSKYFLGFGQPLETATIRDTCYRNLLCQKQNSLIELQQGWFKDFITNVLNYIKNSTRSISDYQEAVTPIAFLATGLPQDENIELLNKIREKLCDTTPHIASVSSRTCNNVKVAFHQLCNQLMEKTCDNYFDDSINSDHEDLNVTDIKSKPKFISADDLRRWYRHSSEQKPIVIIIEDIDFFPLTVAQNLLMAFSSLKLPVIFVVGITSCCENFDSYVPRRCSTTFLYKTFHVNSPAERLNDFLNTMILRPDSGILLSGPVVEFITHTFLRQGHSCTRLQSILQLCMLEHFRTSSSVLCADDETLQQNVWNSEKLILELAQEAYPDVKIKSVNLSTENVEQTVRSSPRKAEPKSKAVKTTNYTDVKGGVGNFHRKKLEWFAALKFLQAFTQSTTMECSFRKTFSDLYTLSWDGAIFKEIEEEQKSAFDVFLGLIGDIHSSLLKTRLYKGIQGLNDFISDYDAARTTTIPSFLAKLQEFITTIENAEKNDERATEEAKNIPLPNRRGSKKLTQADVKQALLEKIQAGKNRHYSTARKAICDYISEEIRNYLKPLHGLPFSKAFIFSDIDFLRDLHTPNPQKRIHVALVEPSQFLNLHQQSAHAKRSKRVVEDSDYPSSDISRVYALILEQQIRNINLNVIFDSFKSMVEEAPQSNKRRSTKVKDPDEQIYLVRFRQAVAELQHMGFLKRSKVKPDEVSRQTFGF